MKLVQKPKEPELTPWERVKDNIARIEARQKILNQYYTNALMVTAKAANQMKDIEAEQEALRATKKNLLETLEVLKKNNKESGE